MSRTAFVGNLSFSATEDELKELFSSAGPVVRARIGMDRETGRSRGFAFVEFATEEACAAAIGQLNGQEMGGRRLRVNDADDKPPPRAAGPVPGGFRPAGLPGRPGGDRFVPRPMAMHDSPHEPAFEPRPEAAGEDFRRRPVGKGSRRGLRARKRSLWN